MGRQTRNLKIFTYTERGRDTYSHTREGGCEEKLERKGPEHSLHELKKEKQLGLISTPYGTNNIIGSSNNTQLVLISNPGKSRDKGTK